jgi:hypothetical protein
MCITWQQKDYFALALDMQVPPCSNAGVLRRLHAVAACVACSMKVGLQKAVTVLDYFEGPSTQLVVSPNTQRAYGHALHVEQHALYVEQHAKARIAIATCC